MNIIEQIKKELEFYTKFEKIFYLLIISAICTISIILHDNKIALLSSLCGITYTLFAGKGKIYCYYIGIIGTFCYIIIAFKNGFYANLALYALYFLPMQIIGIFVWRKHINKKKNEIKKEKLSNKKRLICFVLAVILTITLYFIFNLFEKNPLIDCFSVAFSILGQYLTLKRCIEQWVVWFVVDFATFIMWLIPCLSGANYVATMIMWFIYVILAVYFYFRWLKEEI